jgi:hypothetical protein
MAGSREHEPAIADHAVIERHACAHRRQASAHWRQCSISCAAHCSAHQSQTLAHKAQVSLRKGLLRATASAHKRHSAEHSIQQAGQSFGLSLPIMCVKQLPHSVAQSLQAPMQARMASVR